MHIFHLPIPIFAYSSHRYTDYNQYFYTFGLNKVGGAQKFVYEMHLHN